MIEQNLRKLKNKFVFFDFDGTLCEHRYEDVAQPSDDVWLKKMLFESEIYQTVRPIKTMQNVLNKIPVDNVFVLGVVTTNKEIEQKYIWLKNNFPQIKHENVFFINKMKNKVETLKCFCEVKNINKKDVMMIDDMHSVLIDCEQEGFCAYHPSSFME